MNLIKPSVEIITEPDLFKRIELAARTCYKSEGKICEGSDKALFDKLVKSGHESALEHSNIVVEFNSPVFNLMEDILFAYTAQTSLPHHIRYDVYNADRILCSGNLRAWRSLCKSLPDEFLLCRLFKTHPAFSDIPMSTWSDDGGYSFRIVNEDVHLLPDRHRIITARFVCDRGVSHELVRHRCLSFSQESTRYVNYKDGLTCVEPWWYEDAGDMQKAAFDKSISGAENAYASLIKGGSSPQAARCVLPNATKTEVVATGTVEQWYKYVLPLRLSPAAHPDIRRVMNLFQEAVQREVFVSEG